MTVHWRGLLATAMLLAFPGGGAIAQQAAIVRISVTIVDRELRVRPVPRHALLISQNPTSAAPQRTVTALDGTAEIRLRPGNYTIESEEPLIFDGKAYEWTRTLDVAAGQAAVVELTAANAQTEAAAAPAPNAAIVPGSSSALLLEWQNSVVSIWSATALGAGFLIDARGLIATNQRLVGTATSLEVQLSPTEKFAARVLASDPDRNVAILWINPEAVASTPPVKLGYAEQGTAVAEKQKVFAIETPIDEAKGIRSGAVTRITPRALFSNVGIDDESIGAPLFNDAGLVIAITAPEEEAPAGSSATRSVRIDEARAVIAAAESKMRQMEAPSAARLPVEPRYALPEDAIKDAAARRKGSVAPYRVPAADFDVSLITPVLVYAAHHQGEQVAGRARDRTGRDPYEAQAALRALQDFGNWWDYVRNDPPVLMIRATPKLVEGFWKSILRGAAQTQGVSLPAIKHLKAGFARLRLFCGDAEVTPIHPFKIERRTGETDAVYEGLYVFDPGAIGPHCATVTLTLFSDKAPDRGDARVVDLKIVEQVWQDFAPFRSSAAR